MGTRSTILGFAALIILLTAGAAQGLSGSNTVYSDDIVDGQVTTQDIRENSVTSSRIATGGVFSSDVADNSLTGADIKESLIPGFKKVYYAHVESNGTVTSGDASSALRNSAGLYTVYFASIPYTCVAVANSDTHYTPVASTATSVGSGYVDVRIYDGTANADRPFDVVVVCPS